MDFLEFDELRWLNKYLDYSPRLDLEDLNQLKLFTFMWDMFDAETCKGNCNAQQLANFVLNTLNIASESKSSSFIDAYFTYFKNRYVEDGKTNKLFDQLTYNVNETFTNGETEYKFKDFTQKVLLENNPTEKNRVLATMLIIYRLRFNFFLRDENRMVINDQYKNFAVANNLISILLDKYKKENKQ